jgi:hypothetical protein
MGRNPENQTPYNEFERIFKKPEKIEFFIKKYFAAQASNQIEKTNRSKNRNTYLRTNNQQKNFKSSNLTAGQRLRSGPYDWITKSKN